MGIPVSIGYNLGKVDSCQLSSDSIRLRVGSRVVPRIFRAERRTTLVYINILYFLLALHKYLMIGTRQKDG